MPRKLRIEYPGATYHLMGRGNYRKDLFVQRGSGEAFERAIFEVVERCGWDLFAYVICEEGDPGRGDELMKRYCGGWFTGSIKARKELAKDLAEQTPEADWETADPRDLNEARWESIVSAEKKAAGKSESDVEHDRKAAAWKVATAKRLRKETTANNPWIARRLKMGSPNDVSNLIHA